MSDYGIKITRDGFDVSSSDPLSYVFSSGFNTAAIALQGSANQTGNSGDVKTFTIAHGLSFIPFVLVFVKSSFFGSYWRWCPLLVGSGTDNIGNADQVFNTDIRLDATNLVVRVNLNNGSSDTVTIKYYILNVDI